MCLDGSERRLSGWTAWPWTPVFVPGGRRASGAHRGGVWAASLGPWPSGGGGAAVLLTLESGSAPVWGTARWVWGAPCVQSHAGRWFRGLRGGEPDQEGRGASPRAAPPSVRL